MLDENRVVCTFIGHRSLEDPETITRQIDQWVTLLAASQKPLRFLNGGMGNFDQLCSQAVDRLKQSHPELSIEHWLVIPYITGAFRQDEKNLRKIYDKIITPTCLKDLPNQHALPVRNQWMINQSDYALAYITHPSGGAWQTFQFALQQPHISVVQIGAFQKPS